MGNSLPYPCSKPNVSLPQNDDIITRDGNLQNARTKHQLEQKTFGLTEDQRNQVDLVNVPPMILVLWSSCIGFQWNVYTKKFLITTLQW